MNRSLALGCVGLCRVLVVIEKLTLLTMVGGVLPPEKNSQCCRIPSAIERPCGKLLACFFAAASSLMTVVLKERSWCCFRWCHTACYVYVRVGLEDAEDVEDVELASRRPGSNGGETSNNMHPSPEHTTRDTLSTLWRKQPQSVRFSEAVKYHAGVGSWEAVDGQHERNASDLYQILYVLRSTKYYFTVCRAPIPCFHRQCSPISPKYFM